MLSLLVFVACFHLKPPPTAPAVDLSKAPPGATGPSEEPGPGAEGVVAHREGLTEPPRS
jgi:hypothetical protein